VCAQTHHQPAAHSLVQDVKSAIPERIQEEEAQKNLFALPEILSKGYFI
jgi:hypothetical protein